MKDDSVYLNHFLHMLEMARKALEKVAGLEQADYNDDENLRRIIATGN